jgi:hypothetical protein
MERISVAKSSALSTAEQESGASRVNDFGEFQSFQSFKPFQPFSDLISHQGAFAGGLSEQFSILDYLLCQEARKERVLMIK